jgi:glyoxylase-like metal-dependent hydrolase (beta-lactamase superfamily II)
MGDLAWQALAAPGHDPHALLFWCEDEGILIFPAMRCGRTVSA